eukprot:TRINITY_DN2446_c0_g1_i1.p1 TRINITY_DN2446_c0_g1~~TRINITY_DN2446_c0_g1_i1.p1  ORF type:complete len:559 (-),score=163.77 TRINITY_DN2446_c0_g1_i1:762-2408(-)
MGFKFNLDAAKAVDFDFEPEKTTEKPRIKVLTKKKPQPEPKPVIAVDNLDWEQDMEKEVESMPEPIEAKEEKIEQPSDDVVKVEEAETPKPKREKREKVPAENYRIDFELDEEDRRPHYNIVMIGHVDHGKSTIAGQMLVQTGNVDERIMREIEKEAIAAKREGWKFAYLNDVDENERAKGKTGEFGETYFETADKRFTLLDCPGHAGLVNYMIGGTTQADTAVLVVSASGSEFESGLKGQTKEHAIIAKTLGIKFFIIAVNKMDVIDWDETRFNEITAYLVPFFKKLGMKPNRDYTCVPISGWTGTNMVTIDSDVCPWYTGSSLLDLMSKNYYTDEVLKKALDTPFRMPVSSIVREGTMTTVAGRIETGGVELKSKIIIMPDETETEVVEILVEGKSRDHAVPGSSVKLKLKAVPDDHIAIGHVLSAISHPALVVKKIMANIRLLDIDLFSRGLTFMMHIHALSVLVTVERIDAFLDKKTGELKQKVNKNKSASAHAKSGDFVTVVLTPHSHVCVEKFEDFPQLGRFVLRSGQTTIAFGSVVKVVQA